MRAWHFTNGALRNGDPIPAVGEVLRWDGPLVMCERGLHASVRVMDALHYAPGPTVHRVECSGEMLKDGDKLICRERTILWSLDATDVLRRFARLCALDIVHLWDAPEVVVRYLRTGDESLRGAAQSAAQSAARSAAQSAAWSTYQASAWTAAKYAALSAARYAAQSAARATAWYAAWYAARAAARAAAWWDPALSAARYAARHAQNKRLTRMLNEARRAVA